MKSIFKAMKNDKEVFFIFQKSARAQKLETEKQVIEDDDFFFAIESDQFEDIEEYNRIQEKKKKLKAKKQAEKQAEKADSEVIENSMQFNELQNQINELRAENESLKQNKLQLSYEDAAILYKKKAKILQDISTFNYSRKKLLNMDLQTTNESDPLDLTEYRIKIITGSYGNDKLLETANQLIITEFVQFILGKIDDKINSLKEEVQTIEI